MSQKHLARILSRLEIFQNPLIELEQYSTESDVASELLWTVNMHGLIKDKTILDLCAGTGILGIGALLLGAKKVIFLEQNSSAIVSLRKNIDLLSESYELPEYLIVQEDISFFNPKNIGIDGVDLVIMNPLFSTKIKRRDFVFLEKAFLFSDVVISIHKTSTKNHILNFFRSNHFTLIDVFDFKYHLKKTFENHSKSVVFIEVSGFFGRKNS